MQLITRGAPQLLMAGNIADEMMYLEEKLGIKQVGWSCAPGPMAGRHRGHAAPSAWARAQMHGLPHVSSAASTAMSRLHHGA